MELISEGNLERAVSYLLVQAFMEGHGEANETSNLIREWLGKPIQAKGRCYRNEKYEFGCRGRVVFKRELTAYSLRLPGR